MKKSLDAIAPRMEQLKAAGLLSRGYIYAFDESKEGYSDALRLLFGEVKQRFPGALKPMGVHIDNETSEQDATTRMTPPCVITKAVVIVSRLTL